MKAGRELDALIAEKVMGWAATHEDELYIWFNDGVPGPPKRFCSDIDYYRENPFFWSPSTQIADAWLVVEKLREMGAWISLGAKDGAFNWDFRGIIREEQDDERRFIAHAATAPLAICLAALKAVEGD